MLQRPLSLVVMTATILTNHIQRLYGLVTDLGLRVDKLVKDVLVLETRVKSLEDLVNEEIKNKDKGEAKDKDKGKDEGKGKGK